MVASDPKTASGSAGGVFIAGVVVLRLSGIYALSMPGI
jgi:hypothetical protein